MHRVRSYLSLRSWSRVTTDGSNTKSQNNSELPLDEARQMNSKTRLTEGYELIDTINVTRAEKKPYAVQMV